MKRLLGCGSLIFLSFAVLAQKKPLDHSVYDGWQHIGERLISNDGKWVVYTVDPQEGDNELVIRSADGSYKKTIDRGYTALITEDSRFLVCRIKPLYKDTREARIRKKKPEDFPKDSLAIVELGKDNIWKTAKVRSYKTPQKESGWIGYHLEKVTESPNRTKPADNASKKVTDSLSRIIDSLQHVINNMPVKQKKGKVKQKDAEETEQEDENETYLDFAEGDETPANTDAGSDLVIRNLVTQEEKTFGNVLEFYFSKSGGKLVYEQARNPKDSLSRPQVIVYDLRSGDSKTIIKGGNDFRNFAFSEDGSKLAFVAERDSKPKDLQKFYKLWYYSAGDDTAAQLADRYSVGMPLGSTVSEFGTLSFSKSGSRLFFGTMPVSIPKDTSIIDIDMPKVDIWHYNDDYLQTIQNLPARLRDAQQQNFLSVYDLEKKRIQPLGNRELPQVIQTGEGDGERFVGITDVGKRVESQWRGNTLKDIYAIDVNTGTRNLVKANLYGNTYASPNGEYIVWYDRVAKHYFSWDGNKVRNISGKMKHAVWNEQFDAPDEPNNYGVMGWMEGGLAIFIYDKYDVWALDPSGEHAPQVFTKGEGRRTRTIYRYVQLDNERRYFKTGDAVLLRSQNEDNKEWSLAVMGMDPAKFSKIEMPGTSHPYSINLIAGKNKEPYKLIYTKENFQQSPDIYVSTIEPKSATGDSYPALQVSEIKLSSINPQQANYLWGSSELFKWKAYNGKEATGIVYKPENFDPKKKYPMIVYFYERLSQDLFDYKEPAPIRSAVNVPFFVSRGYVVFMPDIEYKIGYPGQSAFDYIVSGSRALVKKGWVDSTKMALQGHSWGGYQAAQVATMTPLFKAIWAGAPVANMTSAYGGIRWESGVSRQFQYEKTQSRIGGTLWEKLPLYMKNSPLFALDKVTAPMVIMHNDADGAVPWYQGIELFTALRRLGKKVWMFNYNGQGHGLTQRQDMRDYQVRMQQFFDWILKGEKPAKWITEGVPAINKGKDWGLD